MSYCPSGYHKVSQGRNTQPENVSAALNSNQPNRRGVSVSGHLIEETKLDVGVLRQVIQEEYAEVAPKMEGVEWITEYTYS
jgi:hypothetical protein